MGHRLTDEERASINMAVIQVSRAKSCSAKQALDVIQRHSVWHGNTVCLPALMAYRAEQEARHKPG